MTEYFSRILICLAASIIVFSACVAAEIPDMKAVIQKGTLFVTCALAMLVVLPCYCEYHVHQKPSSVTNLLCAADLESYFKEVCISSSNVVMRFHDQGMRYIMINDEESKVSRYGESICLSTNQSMRIVSRGRSLELKGYSNEKDAERVQGQPCIAEFVNQGVSLYVENIFCEGSSTNQLGRLKVTFTNASKEDIRLLESFSNDKDIKHWFSALIFDVNGTPNLDVSMGGKISMRKKMSYITLKRNESFSFILNRETIFPVLSPGEYDIKILYNNQYGESCFHGVLESNKIRVIIKGTSK